MPGHNTPQPGEQQRQEEATQYEQLVASQCKEVAGQTSMRDRDPHTSGGQGTNQNIIDPMTSRAPKHVQDQEEARKAEQKKDTEEQ
jgi:hypothetical protein